MRKILLLLISVSILSCSSNNSKKKEVLKAEKRSAVSVDPNVAEKAMVNANECACIDFAFSEKGDPPLLTHKIGDLKIIVCGYRGNYEDNITLGEKLQDSSFYASGYVVFNCSDTATSQLFVDGEYYLDRIRPKSNELEILRLIRMPQDKSLKYNWTQVISIRFYEQNGEIKTDSGFVLPINNYSQDFMEHFESEIAKLKNDSTGVTNYPDYLIDYSFIQAVKNPDRYSSKLKSLGPFDGYLGPIYRDILVYYKVFEKESAGG